MIPERPRFSEVYRLPSCSILPHGSQINCESKLPLRQPDPAVGSAQIDERSATASDQRIHMMLADLAAHLQIEIGGDVRVAGASDHPGAESGWQPHGDSAVAGSRADIA